MNENHIELSKTVSHEISDDESLVLSEAMKDVKRLCQKKNLVEKERATPHIPTHEMNNMKKLLEETLQDTYTVNVTNLPEYMEGYIEGINPVTVEKLRNGEFSIQKTLDLHGYGSENARRIFEDFIKEVVMSGLQCVRVIHGRGLKSKHKPVLKESLKTWIVKAMHRKWIAAFSSCKMCDGGPGATYILLRKKPEKKKIHIIG